MNPIDGHLELPGWLPSVIYPKLSALWYKSYSVRGFSLLTSIARNYWGANIVSLEINLTLLFCPRMNITFIFGSMNIWTPQSSRTGGDLLLINNILSEVNLPLFIIIIMNVETHLSNISFCPSKITIKFDFI